MDANWNVSLLLVGQLVKQTLEVLIITLSAPDGNKTFAMSLAINSGVPAPSFVVRISPNLGEVKILQFSMSLTKLAVERMEVRPFLLDFYCPLLWCKVNHFFQINEEFSR